MSLNVYWAAYKFSLLQKMEYRVDFVLGVGTAMMLRLSQLAIQYAILHQAGDLNGWNMSQVVFLSGLTALALGVSELFFNNIWMVPYYVVMGDLDRLLVYPVKTLPFLLISNPVIHSFGNILIGAFLACAALQINHIPTHQWLWIPFWALFGGLLYTACLVLAASLSFKMVGPFGHHLFFVHQLLSANQYPLSVYPAFMGILLTFILPFALVVYLPGGWIFGKFADPWCALLGPLAALFMGVFAWKAWGWGVRRYESTGS
jgi:ABC-2 type transport system permease protein